MPPKRSRIISDVETGVAADDKFVMPNFESAKKVKTGEAWQPLNFTSKKPKASTLIQGTEGKVESAASSSAATSSKSASTKVGPFELDNYYIIDCLEGLKLLPDACIDHVCVSPIYNLAGLSRSHGRGLSSSTKCETGWTHRIPYADGFKDCLPEQEYRDMQIEILNEFARVVKPTTGSIFYNHKNRHCIFRDHSPLDWIEKSKLNVFQELIWDRSTSVNAHPSYFIQSTEKIFWLTPTRTGPRFFRDRLPNEFKTHVWKINVRKETKHPAQMPMQIPYNTILSTTEPGDIVLDPFAGGGTTLLAAAILGRRFIGFDICKEYEQMFWERTLTMIQSGELPQENIEHILSRLKEKLA